MNVPISTRLESFTSASLRARGCMYTCVYCTHNPSARTRFTRCQRHRVYTQEPGVFTHIPGSGGTAAQFQALTGGVVARQGESNAIVKLPESTGWKAASADLPLWSHGRATAAVPRPPYSYLFKVLASDLHRTAEGTCETTPNSWASQAGCSR